MAKRIKALTLAVIMVLTLIAVPSGSFAVDATSSATTTAPTTPTTPTTPTKPTTPTYPTTPTEPTAPVVTESYAIPTITRVLSSGLTGDDVTLLQKYLVKLGYTVEVNGKFDAATVTAVKAFQKKSGLVADGYVGAKTNEAIYKAAGGTDVVTTASLVNDIDAFKKGISEEGKWIISTLKNLESKDALVLAGTFKNGKKDATTGADIIQRKIALYTQDEDHKVIDRFTLTAPKLTIDSPNARIQGGTFIGDVYVNAENFKLVDATVQGNVYYTNQAAKDTASIDAKSKVTGEAVLVQELEGDAVATASLTYSNDVFKESIKADGKWIISVLKDMTFTEELVVEGDVLNGKKDANGVPTYQRKVALYSQDEDHKVTRNFTMTAPKITFKSLNARIQSGIFVGDVVADGLNFQLVNTTIKGDVYVNNTGFKMTNTTVEGNIYFNDEAYRTAFVLDATSKVTGNLFLNQVDAVVSPSLARDAEAVVKNASKTGTWIVYLGNDIISEQPIFLNGAFTNKEKADRKLALYSQDDKRNVTRRFTLTAPMLAVNSPSARIEKGNFIGDIYISSPNVKLTQVNVTGNIYLGPKALNFSMVGTNVSGNVVYASTFVRDAAVIDADSKVSGEIKLKY